MSAHVSLEDTWNDVLRKAIRGHAIPEKELCKKSGITASALHALESGHPDHAALGKLAPVLGLDASCLLAMAGGHYHPGDIVLPEGLAMFTTPWDDFQVHSYLVWDPREADGGEPRAAAAFDTGSDASQMLDFLQHNHLLLQSVFLTHAHGDHVFDLDRLRGKTGAPSWMGTGTSLPDVHDFPAGREFSCSSLRIETRSTRGHAREGITYLIHGLERPVAVVGDAIFAGSMGGATGSSYNEALESTRREILSLPPDTLVCPGHGPLTTVGIEREHNPFFPKISPDYQLNSAAR